MANWLERGWDDWNLYTGKKWYGNKSDDINKQYQETVGNATSAANDVWGENANILNRATMRDDGTQRTIGSALDAYDRNAENITRALAGERDAATRAQEFLNPMSEYIGQQVAQNVEGSAGAALQSSGTQNAIARGVADASANNWNSAVNTAMGNSANNQGVLSGMQNISQQTLENDALPQQDLLNMNQDWALTNLQTAAGMAGQTAATSAADKGVFGNLMPFAGTAVNAASRRG